jgi:hypothetical protein
LIDETGTLSNSATSSTVSNEDRPASAGEIIVGVLVVAILLLGCRQRDFGHFVALAKSLRTNSLNFGPGYSGAAINHSKRKGQSSQSIY